MLLAMSPLHHLTLWGLTHALGTKERQHGSANKHNGLYCAFYTGCGESDDASLPFVSPLLDGGARADVTSVAGNQS